MKLDHAAIEKRRLEHPEDAKNLSMWQMQSANLVAETIARLVSGEQKGPCYIPMPTGSGKTTGARWGIEAVAKEKPTVRICFLTPYIKAVEEVANKLQSRLGGDLVGYYTSDKTFEEKLQALGKQVVVLTHKFLADNQGMLNDRDLFVVDEALYATDEANLTTKSFADARHWARRNGYLAEEFNQLFEYMEAQDQAILERGLRFMAIPAPEEEWALTLATELQVKDYSQTLDEPDVLRDVKIFCEAWFDGKCFVANPKQGQGGYTVSFAAARLGIPNLETTVVLSATGGLMYDLAGNFEQDESSKAQWSSPNYKNLEIVQLTGPYPRDTYDLWSKSGLQDELIDYVDWLIIQIPESQIYMTVPKKILDKFLLRYFEQTSKDAIEYPIELTKHGKKVFVSNHARSVGSNSFRDCGAVVYLWDNHLPSVVAIQRKHSLSATEITQEELENANTSNGQSRGRYAEFRDAQYLENMMQHIGRGKIRIINDEGIAAPMKAYVLTNSPKRLVSLVRHYSGSRLTDLTYDNEQPKRPRDRLDQVAWYFAVHNPQQDVCAKVVEEFLGFRLSAYKEALQEHYELLNLGYKYVPGKRGSYAGNFVYTKAKKSQSGA